MKHQNIEGARNIYGDQFDSLVSEFNHLMGVK
jgi:hypothetical protein